MNFRTSSLCAAISVVALAMTVQNRAHAAGIHFTPLNDPNAVAGTTSNAISDLGAVAGNYEAANGLYVGFVGAPPYSNKSFTAVEAAGSPILTNVWDINLVCFTAS